MGPGQLHGPTSVPDQDHVAELAALEQDGAPAAAAVVVHPLPLWGAGLAHGEPDDLTRAGPGHVGDQRVICVEHAEAATRDRLHYDALDPGELLHRVDAA